MPEFKLNKTVAALKDLMFLGTFITTVVSALFALMFTLLWPVFISKLAADLNLATKEDVAAIQERLDIVTGDDGILKVVEGHTYIGVPVKQDQVIEMTLTASRSEKGQSCSFVGGSPMFLDNRNIPFPGSDLKVITQFTTAQARVQIEMRAPKSIQPGRVGVYLALRYSCPFGAQGALVNVFEDTSVVFFQLDPA